MDDNEMEASYQHPAEEIPLALSTTRYKVAGLTE